MRSGLLAALLTYLPMTALADTVKPTVALPESRAAELVKKLPKEALKEIRPFREPDNVAQPSGTQLLDEIRIYGVREPEDLRRPEKTPLAKLQDSLGNGFRPTPARQLCGLAQYIGLCPTYTVEGLPPEGSIEERTETRSQRTIVQQKMAGTIQ